jgi:hypothetical protein
MRRYGIITIALVLLLGASVYASKVNSIVASKVYGEADKVIVPVELKNDREMVGLDFPLKFSEGATLREVTFEGTRSENFDFKWATIDNEANTVVIGLIPMMFGEKPDLAPGEGVIANLVFTVEDPSLQTLDLKLTSMENPEHSLMFVYFEGSEMKVTEPEFEGISVVLSEVASDGLNLPKTFALRQNVPNPFNPDTRIDYDLPAPMNVRLEVINILGQTVKTLVNDFQTAGTKTVIWNGSDDAGAPVASGVYFYRINAGDNVATKKMMMLK